MTAITDLRPASARRSDRPTRRLLAVVGVAAAAAATLTATLAATLTATLATGSTAGAAVAERPAEAPGDPQAPVVAHLASTALDALGVYQRSGAAADGRAFDRALVLTARSTATELGVSALRMTDAWADADEVHQTALLTALTQLGVEYQSATSEPGVGFDCSGLMLYAWGEAGVALTRQSGSQISQAEAREPATAMAGDLAQYPGHVMMYLGVPQAFVHAANPEDDVELWRISEDRAAALNYGDPSS